MSEKYQPTPEEIQKAEDFMTDAQKFMSKQRHEGYMLGRADAFKDKKVKKTREEKPFDPEILNKSIDIIDLGPNLTAKFQSMCKAKNINTVQELINHSDVDLLRGKNFGRKSLNALTEWLSERGLKLKKFVRKNTWEKNYDLDGLV